MEDAGIVQLYWDRSERAVTETDAKYGPYCYSIAYNALGNAEDAEETVSDTYMAAWNKLPPHRPMVLKTFLGKITRCISINRWSARNAHKRGGGEVPLTLDELVDCADGKQDVERLCESIEMIESFNAFLDALPEQQRNVFLRRYWFFEPIAEIAQTYGFTQSKVTAMLHRTRGKLKNHLIKEGYL